jgi:hypothetical protein
MVGFSGQDLGLMAELGCHSGAGWYSTRAGTWIPAFAGMTEQSLAGMTGHSLAGTMVRTLPEMLF